MTDPASEQQAETSRPALPVGRRQAFLEPAGIVGRSWRDFVGDRLQAYATMIDDLGHCQELNDAGRVQSTFGRETIEAYSEQAAKLGGMMLKAHRKTGSSAE
jgi:hypothetical protein